MFWKVMYFRSKFLVTSYSLYNSNLCSLIKEETQVTPNKCLYPFFYTHPSILFYPFVLPYYAQSTWPTVSGSSKMKSVPKKWLIKNLRLECVTVVLGSLPFLALLYAIFLLGDRINYFECRPESVVVDGEIMLPLLLCFT